MLHTLAVWGLAMAAVVTPLAVTRFALDEALPRASRAPTIMSQVRRGTALIALRKLPGGPPPARGWTNRHPVAVYTVIILVILVVAAVTLRLLRTNGQR